MLGLSLIHIYLMLIDLRDEECTGSDVHAVQTGFQILAGALLVTQVDELSLIHI